MLLIYVKYLMRLGLGAGGKDGVQVPARGGRDGYEDHRRTSQGILSLLYLS